MGDAGQADDRENTRNTAARLIAAVRLLAADLAVEG
jgi:hypothetical protein